MNLIKLIKIVFPFLVIVLGMQGLYAQTKKEFDAQLEQVVGQCRSKVPYNSDFEKYNRKFPEFVFKKTKDLLQDSSSEVRFFAINLISKLASTSQDQSIRQAGVFSLLNTNPGSLYIAAKELQQFNKEDFNGASKDSLRAFIKTEEKRQDEIIMLVGYLDMYDQITALRNLLSYPENLGAKERWKIRLALARMGDIDEINNCIEFGKKNGCSLQAVYRVFPDLIYTRQKNVFDYLIEIMQNDTIKTPSANPSSNKKIACGYRIMELFPGIVEGYPLKHAFGKQIATNDYKKALQTARQWFIDNPDYKINKDKF